MARSVVDLASVEISSETTGTVLCRAIESIDIDDEDPGLEVVETMTPERAGIGYKEGVTKFRLRINHKILIPREVDYRRLKQNRELFLVAYQELAGSVLGEKFQAIDCRVLSVSKSFNKDGDAMDVVEILALRHISEPFSSLA